MAGNRILTPVDEPTWVYYAYCLHSGLVYVGISRDVKARISQHRHDKSWWREEVFDVIATLFPTRRQALEVEAHAIKTFRPARNIAGQSSLDPMPHEIPPHNYTTLAFLDHRGVG